MANSVNNTIVNAIIVDVDHMEWYVDATEWWMSATQQIHR